LAAVAVALAFYNRSSRDLQLRDSLTGRYLLND
jgi:hypothetical protein